MIIDLQRFIEEERRYWTDLESVLDQLGRDPLKKMALPEIKRFHYLYQRTSSDLARVMELSAETEIRRYLESLVGQAYAEIHEIREKSHRFSPLHWFFDVFPQTFRRHLRAFALAVSIMALGIGMGGIFIAIDKEAKRVLLPFPHLQTEPSERVAYEEKTGATKDRLSGAKATFSAFLMTHNTRVSLFTFAMGFTWGIGTILLLFYNGIILGAVAIDFIRAGQSAFLFGWLLPHGAIEIPAILLAGQSGFILAGAMIGWGRRVTFKKRLRMVAPELVTLLSGLAIMLIWAGMVEAFFSQYHAPVISYPIKIGFGAMELMALIFFLGFSGKFKEKSHAKD